MSQFEGPLPAIPRLHFAAAKQHFAAIHPFSGSARKNWPLERYRALKLEMPVEFAAGPEEKLPEARRFENLADLASWLASASVYIGNDSGISHLAAAVGTPTLALFGPTRPALWAPRGPHVRMISKSDLEAIEIDDVEQAVRDLLSGGR